MSQSSSDSRIRSGKRFRLFHRRHKKEDMSNSLQSLESPSSSSSPSVRRSSTDQVTEVPKDLSFIDVTPVESTNQHASECQYSLRVYCEQVREGMHYRTLQCNATTKAGWCIEELVHNYFPRFGQLDDFDLYLVVGRISAINNVPGLGHVFHEVRAEVIAPNTLMYRIFQQRLPPESYSRRIELRLRIKPQSGASSLRSPRQSFNVGSPTTTMTPTPDSSSLTSSPSDMVRYVSDMDLRRNNNNVVSRALSRSKSKLVPVTIFKAPSGPHLTLLRGRDQVLDSTMHDLSSIIIKERQNVELTIGTSPNANIMLHNMNEFTDISGGDSDASRSKMIAKLVGYMSLNESSSADKNSSLSPFIRLEPALSTWLANDTDSIDQLIRNPCQNFPALYVNEEKINHTKALRNYVANGSPNFVPLRLKQGDIVTIGSRETGYSFLFHDPLYTKRPKEMPRIVIVHQPNQPTQTDGSTTGLSRAETVLSPSGSDNASTTSGNGSSSTSHRQVDVGGGRRPKEIGLATAGQLHRIREHQQPDYLPSEANLALVVSNLFVVNQPSSLSMASTNSMLSVTSSSLTTSAFNDPSRVAGLLGHLVRSAGLLVRHPDPPSPNSDSGSSSTASIHSNMRRLIIEVAGHVRQRFDQLLDKSNTADEQSLRVGFWLAQTSLDLALYLTPDWLTSQQIGQNWLPSQLSSPTSATNNSPLVVKPSLGLEPPATPGSRSVGEPSLDAGRSPTSSSLTTTSGAAKIEQLPEIVDLKNQSLESAESAIDRVIGLVFLVLSSHLKLFFLSSNDVDSISVLHPQSRLSDSTNESSNYERFIPISDVLTKLQESFHTTLLFNISGNDLPRSLSRQDSNHSSFSPSISGWRNVNQEFVFGDHLDVDSLSSRHRKQSRNGEGSISSGSTSSISSIGGGGSSNDGRNRMNRPSLGSSSSSGSVIKLESVLWRRLTARLGHDLMELIITDDSINVDEQVGRNLLSALDLLSDWLKARHMDKHARPLNVVIDWAKLLAQPRDALLKMSWVEMRLAYPDLPPALIRFLLEQYEDGSAVRLAPSWAVNIQDSVESDEEPLDIIAFLLRTWRSKESLKLIESASSSSKRPINLPIDLYQLLNSPASLDMIRRLDAALEANQVNFRWAELLYQFKPAQQALTLQTEDFRPKRPQSRQAKTRLSLAGPLRASHTNIASHLKASTPTAFQSSSRLDSSSSPTQLDNRARLSGGLANQRPPPTPPKLLGPTMSNQGPVQIKREFENDNKKRDSSRTSSKFEDDGIGDEEYDYDKDSRRMAKGSRQYPHHLARSVQADFAQQVELVGTPEPSDFNRTFFLNGQPTNTLRRTIQPSPFYNSQSRDRNPFASANFSKGQTPQFFAQKQTKYMQSTGNRPNRLGQSVNYNVFEPEPLPRSISSLGLNRRPQDYLSSNKTLTPSHLDHISQDWRTFQKSDLGVGVDRARRMGELKQKKNKYQKKSSTQASAFDRFEGHTFRDLSASLPSTEFKYNAYRQRSIDRNYTNDLDDDDIDIDEDDSVSVSSLAESDKSQEFDGKNEKEEDFSENGQYSSGYPESSSAADLYSIERPNDGCDIANVVVHRSSNSEMGLTLVNGELTIADQPGVYIKEVSPVCSAYGQLSLGDRIIAVNGQEVAGFHYKHALRLIKSIESRVTFTIQRNCLPDPSDLLTLKD